MLFILTLSPFSVPQRSMSSTSLVEMGDRGRVRVKSIFALVGGPPPLRASDGLATCWAYHSQGGCSSNCDHKWDHCPSAAEDLGPQQEYTNRIQANL